MIRDRVREIYDRIPSIECSGKCFRACGPIILTKIEAARIEARTEKPLGIIDILDLRCPYLDDDHRCSVYEDRPAICRLYGVVDDDRLRCEHGCKPERMLSNEEAAEILEALDEIGGGETSTVPLLRVGE